MDSHIKPQPFNRLWQKLLSLTAATNVVGLNESGPKVGSLANSILSDSILFESSCSSI